jgi:hypothetical protein
VGRQGRRPRRRSVRGIDVCHEIANQLGVHVFAADDEDALLGRGTRASQR